MLKLSIDVFDYHLQPHFPSPSSSDRRAAASTAFITAPRIPPASSTCTAAMVVPPGLVTWSFSAPGCSPVSCAHTHGFQAATSTSLADAFHKLCGIRTHQPSRLRFEVDQDEPVWRLRLVWCASLTNSPASSAKDGGGTRSARSWRSSGAGAVGRWYVYLCCADLSPQAVTQAPGSAPLFTGPTALRAFRACKIRLRGCCRRCQ
eukprot:COSAG04_NODE_5201_length_1704_cov_4.778193_2_plen_204_part_00